MVLYETRTDVFKDVTSTFSRMMTSPDFEDYVVIPHALYALIKQFFDVVPFEYASFWRDKLWCSTVGATYQDEVIMWGNMSKNFARTETPYKGYSLISLYWDSRCEGTVIVRRDTGEFVGSVSNMYKCISSPEVALLLLQFKEYRFV